MKKILLFLLLSCSQLNAVADLEKNMQDFMVHYSSMPKYKKLVDQIQSLLNQGMTDEEILETMVEEKGCLWDLWYWLPPPIQTYIIVFGGIFMLHKLTGFLNCPCCSGGRRHGAQDGEKEL